MPQMDTLVACGQYDSFTLPHENAHFALQCPEMQFAMIANADHVPQLQRRKETMTLFTTYLKGDSIHGLDGIINLTREDMQKLERRGEARIQVLQSQRQLTHRHSDHIVNVEIVDLNYFGLWMKLDNQADLTFVDDHPRDLALNLSDDEGEFAIECLIFETSEQGVRALFKHGSFENADRLLRFVARQTQEQQVEAIV